MGCVAGDRKKKEEEDSGWISTCGWNSKFENVAEENV